VPIKVTKRWHPRQRFDHGEPISKPNFSLTVGVWVGLLAMFQVSHPIPTHALEVFLPEPGIAPIDRAKPIHTLRVTQDGSLFWNGSSLPQSVLPEVLDRHVADPSEPGLIFIVAPNVSYDWALQVLSPVVSSGATSKNFCFGDLEKYADFSKSSAVAHTPSGGAHPARRLAKLMHSIYLPERNEPEIPRYPPEAFEKCAKSSTH